MKINYDYDESRQTNSPISPLVKGKLGYKKLWQKWANGRCEEISEEETPNQCLTLD